LKHSIEPPVYSQIALDIAARIARGDLKEKAKISGRSLMASEYNVSPETIRRSFQLLVDMDIIEVLPNSGAIILSREKALNYIEKYNVGKDFRSLKNELKDLLNERDHINNQIIEIIDNIFDISERFRNINPLHTLEFEIPENSLIIGKTVNETNFWHNTGATIVAMKRADKMILSPGPCLIFRAHDVIIVTGDTGISQRIEALIGK
jgi:K+/H+ antiporter YhaU regulatory subunit KhtT